MAVQTITNNITRIMQQNEIKHFLDFEVWAVKMISGFHNI